MVGIALPIIMANLGQSVVGLVDTAIAGNLPGAWQLGGVALGGVVFHFVFWAFSFLRMSTTGLVAQAWGAQNSALMRIHFIRAAGVGLIAGTIIIIFRAPLMGLGLDLLGGSDAVRQSAEAFVSARVWSAPATLGNIAIAGYLLGSQRVMLALMLQVALNVFNLVATLLLVYGFDMGVAGIGAGSAIADWLVLAVGIVLVKPLSGKHPLDWKAVFDRTALLHMVSVNRDIFLRSLSLLICFGWFARMGAEEGDAVLAANAILLNFHAITSQALDGFAQATESFVGAAFGRRRSDMLPAILKAACIGSGVVAVGFALVYALAGPAIIEMSTAAGEVRDIAIRFLPYQVILPFISVTSYMLDGVFIGAVQTRQLRNSMFISMAFFMLIANFAQQALGNHGLWLALLGLMVMRTVTLSVYLRKLLATVRVPE